MRSLKTLLGAGALGVLLLAATGQADGTTTAQPSPHPTVWTRVYAKTFNLTDSSGFLATLHDVPAGRYVGSFSGHFTGPTDTAFVDCFVANSSNGASTLADYKPASPDGFYTLHAADIVVVPTTADLTARCTGSSGHWAGQIRVGLTRITKLSHGATTVAKP